MGPAVLFIFWILDGGEIYFVYNLNILTRLEKSTLVEA